MYDNDDYFSNDINSEYWDDVYYDETHPDRGGSGGRYSYGGGNSGTSLKGILGAAFFSMFLVSWAGSDACGFMFMLVLALGICAKYGK